MLLFDLENLTQLYGRDSPQKFAGRYEIIQELGRGGMGAVYKACDIQLGRIVALKLLTTWDRVGADRFLREARTMAKLSHPNIVGVYDIGTAEGRHFFTMDFVEGETLSRLLANSSLSIRRAVDLAIKVTGALEYAHAQGVIHRDLKPANIIVDRAKNPRVMDFGLAKVSEVSRALTRSGMVMGTVQYMSPEQACGEAVDPRSDVYAMGVLLYEMLTGHPPFYKGTFLNIVQQIFEAEPTPPSKINPRVPGELENICHRALEKKPEHRYQNAGELSRDLQRFVQGKSLAKPGRIEILSQRIKKNPRAALAAVLLAATFLFIWSIARGDKKEEAKSAPPLHRAVDPLPLPPVLTEEERPPQTDGVKFRGDLCGSGVYQGRDIAVLKGARWKFKAQKAVESSPAVWQDVLYCGSNDGKIYALDCTCGKCLWFLQTGSRVVAAPALADGTLYCGSLDRSLYAVEAATGKVQWTFAASGHIASSPAIAGDNLLFGCGDGTFYALDRKGGLRWKVHTGGPINSSPCVAGGMVYFGSDDHCIYAVDLHSGKHLWNFATGAQIGCSPAHADNTIYCGSLDSHFYAIDAAGGKLRWKLDTGARNNSCPAVAEGVVYFGSDTGNVYAVSGDDGRLLWTYRTSGMVSSSPAVTKNMLYVGSHDNFLYALDLHTGALRWKFKTADSIFSSPAVVNDTVYFGSNDGYIYALW